MSVRWQHCVDHADKYSKECLLGVVSQPIDSRLSENKSDKRCVYMQIAVYDLDFSRFSFVNQDASRCSTMA